MVESLADFNSLSAAFLQVKENHGCAGVDGVTIESFEEELNKNLSALVNELERKSYLPLPLLKILVDKGNGEARDLCIPAVRDRVVQTALLHVIEPILDREFENCSFAFRKGHSVKQAVYKIKEYFEQGYRWVIDADIDSYFDSVDHALLMEKVRRYLKDEDIVGLIQVWIGSEVWDGESLKVMKKGIPQGSPISPILANLFLDDFDEVMLRRGQRYVRFADDFLVLCRNKEEAEKTLGFTTEELEKLLLNLDEADIVTFDQGFKFLGVTFLKSLIMVPFDRPGRERKVLFCPPPLNMAAYHLKKYRGW